MTARHINPGLGLGVLLLLNSPLSTASAATEDPTARPQTPPASDVEGGRRPMTLRECQEVALQNNHRRPVSRFAVAMAEAQHRQALSGYWPQVGLKTAYQRMDAAPNFVFPASQMYIPAQSISVPGGAAAVTIPANAFGPGSPPADVQMPVAYPGRPLTRPPRPSPYRHRT